MSDRTVHAAYRGMEIVRYDRAGKWYLEPTDSRLPRQRVTVQTAARQAAWAMDNAKDSWVNERALGGQTFVRLYKALQ